MPVQKPINYDDYITPFDDIAAQYAQPDIADVNTEQPTKDRNQVAAGIATGIDNLQSTAFGLASLIGDAVDSESLMKWGMDGYRRNKKEAQNSGLKVNDYEDIHNFSDGVDYALGGLGQAIPSIFTMIGTGGVGGLVVKQGIKMAIKKKIAEKGLSKAAGDKVLARVMKSKSVNKAIQKGQGIGAYAGTSGMETGEVYGDVADKGFTGAEAIGKSVGTGLAAGAFDIVPFMGVAKKFGFGGSLSEKAIEKLAGKGITRRVAEGAATTAAKEGVTEALQTGIEEVGKASITGAELPADLGHQMINSGLIGAVGGAAMGGAGGVPSHYATAPKEPTPEGDTVDPQSLDNQNIDDFIDGFSLDEKTNIARDMAETPDDHQAVDEAVQTIKLGASRRQQPQVDLPQGDLGNIEQQPTGVVGGQAMPGAAADQAAMAQFDTALPADHPYLDGSIAADDLQVLADTGNREAQNALMIRKQLENSNEQNQNELVSNEYGAAEVKSVTPSFETTPKGAIKITNANDATISTLKENKIKFVVNPKANAILVAKRHTEEAMHALGMDASNEVVQPTVEAPVQAPQKEASKPVKFDGITNLGGYAAEKNKTVSYDTAEQAKDARPSGMAVVQHPHDPNKFALRKLSSIPEKEAEQIPAKIIPAPKIKKPSNTLLGRIRQHGGIAMSQLRDITNEDNVKNIGVVGDQSTPEASKKVDQQDNSDVPFKREESVVVASPEKLSMVSRVVERFIGRVILLPSFKDAPAAIQNKANKEGHDGSDVDGVYHNGKVYLLQDALARHSNIEAKVEETVLHEETHAGLRKMFGQEFIVKMNSLFVAMGGYKGMRAITDKHGIDLKAYMEANHIAELNADTRSAFMMDELLAHLGHEKPSIAKRAKEIVGMIRQWVRSKGLLKLAKYSDADLLHLIKVARKAKGKVKDGDVSFIRRSSEKKDLYIAHNLTAENLVHADKMGGIAVPSLAVNRVGTGALTGFGEISLVSGSDMINNKTAKTFNADVYSPRYPDVQRVIKQEDYQKEFGRDNELADKYGFSHVDKDGIETGRFRPEIKTSTIMVAYLDSLGKAPRVKMTQDDIAPAMRKFVGRDQYELSRDQAFAKEIVAENNAKRQKYVESGKMTQEKADSLWGDKPSESMLYNRAGAISRLHKGKYPDSYANRQAVDKKFESLSKKTKDGYTDWLSSRIERATNKEQIFNGFNNNGNRKYLPHNLDTVVRIMKRNLRDGEGFNYGLGSIRSTVANQFRSIKAIKEARGDIVSTDKMDAIKVEVETEYEDLKAKLEPYDTVYSGDIFDDSLKELATNGVSSFKDYYPNLPDSVRHSAGSFLNKLRNMPTEYFESKMQRAVSIDEFSGAAIPKDASKKTIEVLKKNGLDIEFYKPNDEVSRENAIKKLSKKRDLLFSKGKVPDVVAQLTGNEITGTGKELVANVRSYFRKHLNQTHVDSKAGDVLFNSVDSNKLRSVVFRNKVAAKIVPAIKDIIQHGTYEGREELHKIRKDNAVAFHKFRGFVKVGNDIVEARIDVMEDSDRKLFYSIEGVKKATNVSSEQAQVVSDLKRSVEQDDINIKILSVNGGQGQTVAKTKQDLIQQFGSRMKRAIEKGKVVIHRTAANAPKNLTDENSTLDDSGQIQGWYSPDGTINIVAENNDADSLAGVVLHEAKHRFDDSAKGQAILAKSIKQIKQAKDLARSGRGKVAAWITEAEAAIPSDTPEKDYYHELFAYAVQQYHDNMSALPNTIKNIVKRYVNALTGFIRAHLLKAGIPVKVTPAAMASLARSELNSMGKRNGVFSGETAYGSKHAGTFYSQMRKVLVDKLPGKSSPGQFKQMIQAFARKGQFKQEELEWSGVEDWLDTQEGKITKQQLLDFMAANEIQVEEVEKGTSKPITDWTTDGDGIWRSKIADFHIEKSDYSDDYLIYTKEHGGSHLSTAGSLQEAMNDASNFIAEQNGDDVANRTKFADYQFPNGENYRELLLTFPDTENKYTSPHYDEPNILAHVRFNERTDTDGKKVLFIEEVQSDWHQDGRKKGYRSRVPQEIFKKYGIDSMHRLARDKLFDKIFMDIDTKEAVGDWKRFVKHESNINSVPNAPFKTTWPILAMKRMIRYASENGFDSIAWTTGEQQAERYDLSKKISAVHYSGTNLKAYDHDGNTVISQTGVLERDLPDYIGKDAAERLISAPKKGTLRSIEGEDLKVGGEGMAAFYDKMLPSTVNKYIKKWGARVSGATIDTTGYSLGDTQAVHSLDITDKMRIAAMQGQPLFAKTAKEYGISIAEAKRQHDAVVAKYKGTDQWMKAPNDKPTKLNEKQWVQTRTPAFKAWFGDWENDPKNASKVVDENGEPMVVYHGTDKLFTEYSADHVGVANNRIGGEKGANESFAFAENKRVSEYFANKTRTPSGVLYPDARLDAVFIAAKTPLIVDMENVEKGSIFETAKAYDTGREIYDIAIVKEPSIRRAKAKRHDGVVFSGGYDYRPFDGDIVFAFAPAQIKSATGNTGQFNANNSDIRYSKRKPADSIESGNLGGAPEETRIEKWQRVFQDGFNRVKVVQNHLGNVNESNDVYAAEERSSGIIAARLDDLDIDHVKPLLKDMQDADVTLEKLDKYLIAKHAQERNDYVASINPDMPDGGSGMTNSESKRILSFYSKRELKDLESLADKVYAINKKHVKDMLDGHLIDHETADLWLNQYDYYVPLKGKEGADGQGTGSGYQVRNSGIQAVKGRGAGNQAESPTAHAIAQAESAIVRSENTKIGHHLVKLVMDNQDKTLWSITKSNFVKFQTLSGDLEEGFTKKPGEHMIEGRDYHRVIGINPKDAAAYRNGETSVKPKKTVYYRVDPQYNNRDDVFTTLIKGKQYSITIKDKIMVEQLKKLNASQLNELIGHAGTLNRFLAMINTALNPEFVITNLERDLTTAGINLGGEHGAKMAKDVFAAIPSAMAGIKNYYFGDRKHPMAKVFNEMKHAGGAIGFFGLEDNESKVANINKRLHNIDPGAWNSTKRGFRALRDTVLDANQIVENASRLAAYKVAMDNEFSKNQAAKLSKNLTVNFNRRGEAGAAINAGYLFFNASVQGTARIFTALKHPAVQKIVGASAAAAFALSMYNMGAGGDDDDGISRWEKVPDYIKQTNIVIMNNDGTYEKYKLPYGYNLFWYAGVAMHDLMYGKLTTPIKTAMNIATTAMNAFNPLAGANLIDTITPTILKPIEQSAMNKNFMNLSIVPESAYDNSGKPDSEKAFTSTSPYLKAFSRIMNNATGGDAYHSGLIDMSPETIKHYIKWVTGGAGMTAYRTVDSLAGAMDGESVELRRIPFARTTGGDIGTRFDADRYYSIITKLNATKKEWSDLKSTDIKESMRFRRQHADELRLYKKIYRTNKKIKSLRATKRIAQLDRNSAEVKRLSMEIAKLMRSFTKDYGMAK